MVSKNLAVKYRPTKFSDVSEQKNIIKILENQIEMGNIAPAYIFAGASGSGKTTSARIFAKTLNSEMHDINAASNNSVDDMRSVIEDAKFKSTNYKYKVYILDEAHMLSQSAWNSMLKIIEEPPLGVVFIFCSTEFHKIPLTIQNRCQQFWFTKISNEGILKRLKEIINKESIEQSLILESKGINNGDIFNVDDKALEFIVKLSQGCMRDAIQLMEKCLSFSYDLNMENVLKSLNVSGYDEALI